MFSCFYISESICNILIKKALLHEGIIPMLFSQALLNATYKNGKPGKPTEEHENAEHHRFKSQYLFKNKKIPKDLYVSRLIQHFLIIKAIETQLQSLSDTGKSEINAFFALSYLEQLWRTPGIQSDLQQLGVNPDAIKDKQIAKTTKRYLQDIEKFAPQSLLAHFLYHVAGFMHGGNIIRSRYIEPSNSLTTYQIPTKQYDFFSAAELLPSENHIGKRSSMDVYQDMMKQIDNITLSDEEYKEVLEQGKMVYGTMTEIYDDLCDMHTNYFNLSFYGLAAVSIGLLAVSWGLKMLIEFINPMMDQTSTLTPA